jgi:hypothetical protein
MPWGKRGRLPYSNRRASVVQWIRQILVAIGLWAVSLPAIADGTRYPCADPTSPFYTVWEPSQPRRPLPKAGAPVSTPFSDGTVWLDPLPPDCVGVPGCCQPADAQGGGPECCEPEFELIEDSTDEQAWHIGQADGCPAEDFAGADAWWWTTSGGWLRDLSIFGGVHGFKGPFDRGRNGNFGIHEGINFGAPLGFWDWGWQAGLAAYHSNFFGDQALGDHSSVRNQFFVTGGIFRRTRTWGFQWGVTYDWLHDEYYAKTDLKQIRSDTSFVFPGGKRELGYFGAYGTGGTDFVLINRELQYYIFQEPTDIFAFYYRRYFEGGGDGRVWIGWSGNGDGVVGAEVRVPMGKDWALENRLNYLVPKHGGAEGEIRESWAVTIQLVWYPISLARCVRHHPFRPMLNVADDTLFMTDTFVPPPRPL